MAVITGAGNAFSAGGDFDMIEKSIGNADVIAAAMPGDRGQPGGAGLAVARGRPAEGPPHP